MEKVQPSLCNYRNLVGAASELNDMYIIIIRNKFNLKNKNWKPVILMKHISWAEKHTSCCTKLCFLTTVSTCIPFQ